MNCHCDDEDCEKDIECRDGASLWISVRTDSYLEEISFLLMDSNEWDAILWEGANFPGLDPLSENSLNGKRSGNLIHRAISLGKACAASTLKSLIKVINTQLAFLTNICAVILFRDSYGDGLGFPGVLDVFVEGKSIAQQNQAVPFFTCQYQFGSCDKALVAARQKCLQFLTILMSNAQQERHWYSR